MKGISDDELNYVVEKGYNGDTMRLYHDLYIDKTITLNDSVASPSFKVLKVW